MNEAPAEEKEKETGMKTKRPTTSGAKTSGIREVMMMLLETVERINMGLTFASMESSSVPWG